MKRVTGGRAFVSCVCFLLMAGPALAGPVTVGLYRDTRGSSCSFASPAPGITTAHVVVHPDERGFRAVRFAAPLPSCLGAVWVTDIATERTTFIGDSQTGISVASGWCEDVPTHILDIQYLQSGSTAPCCEFPVLADPYVQMIELVDCDHSSFSGTGATAYFNANLSCLCGVNEPPATPSNPSPADAATGISVMAGLGWSSTDPLGDVVWFDLYLGTDPNPSLQVAGLTQPSFQPATPLAELTTFYWRVVARDEWGSEASGPVWSFTTRLANSPPTEPGSPWPPMGMTGVPRTPQLVWQCADIDGDAIVYDVYLGTGMAPPLAAAQLPTAQYSPSLAWDTYYYWRVVARDPLGHETAGPLWGFRTRPEFWPPEIPSSPSPPDGTTGKPITAGQLTWSCSDRDVGDVLVYDIYFGTTSPPPKVVTGRTTRSYSHGTLTYDTQYYWKIVARDNHGLETPGPTWSFDTAANLPPQAPSNPSPSHLATNVSLAPTMTWLCADPNGDALRYDVYFGPSATPPRVATSITPKSYSPSALAFSTTYYWRVVARDASGLETAGSTWSFTTKADGAPPAPSNPSPANGLSGVATNTWVSWQCNDPDAQPLTFDVYFGTTSPPPLAAEGVTTKSYTPGTLALATRYYWRVTAHDNTGHQTSGPTWYFDTRGNTAPGAPHSPSPPNNGQAFATPTLTWSASDPDGQALTYFVYFGDTSPPPLAASGLTERSYTPGVLESSGKKYYWRVAVFDGFVSTSGPTWSFTTLRAGDVNLDGQITATDATCAMDQVMWIPCGSSVAADVTCSSGVTPRDARCIHRRALAMECAFCGEVPAPSAPAGVPGIGVLSTWEWGDTLYCRLGVWNVPSFESFGFMIESGPVFVRAQRRAITNDWVTMRSKSYGLPGVPSLVGGYSLTGSTTQPSVASEFIDLRFLANGTYWVRVTSYKDDLAGAADLYFELPQPQIPVLISRFDAVLSGQGVELSWRLQSDEAMESFTLYRRDNGSPPAVIARGAVEGTTGRHLDTSVSPGQAYEYELVIRTTDGDEFRSQTRRVTMAALSLMLGANHPNPFNPQTTIPYSVPSSGAPVRVRLAIYDTSGRLVRVLVDENQAGGERDVVWRGDDSSGQTVTSGVYFCVLQAGTERRTRKLVLLK